MHSRASGLGTIPLWWVVAAVLFASCGEKGASDPGARPDETPDAAAVDAAPVTTDAGPVTALEPYPGGCTSDGECQNGACHLGICVAVPPRDLEARFACDEALVEATPDLDCWDSPAPLADGPAAVPARGVVEFFGDGSLTVGLRVRFYDYASFDPSPCVDASASARDVFEARRLVEACVDEANPNPLADTTTVACADRDDVGCYAVESLPTGRPLVVRIWGEEQTWVPTYEYGVFINPCVEEPWSASGTCPADGSSTNHCSLRQVGDEAVYYDDLTIISTQTYQTFPPTAGIGRIERGEGTIAGRQFDCAGRSVAFASVGVHRSGRKTTYFNDDPDNILPQPGLLQTNVRGTYAELSLPTGPQGIVSVAWLAGRLRTVNFRRLFVLPDSVTFVNTPGRLPVETEPPY